MSEDRFSRLQREFANAPNLLAYFEARFGEEDPEVLDALTRAVDQSDFGLREWVEALRVLGQWLDGRGQRLPVSDQIGYVGCAAESAGAGANMTDLPSLVREMLDAYGCERASEE